MERELEKIIHIVMQMMGLWNEDVHHDSTLIKVWKKYINHKKISNHFISYSTALGMLSRAAAAPSPDSLSASCRASSVAKFLLPLWSPGAH